SGRVHVGAAARGAAGAGHPDPGNRPRAVPIMTGYRKARLFLVSSLAPTMAGVGSALRANTAADLQRVFFDSIDKAHSGEMIANVIGLPFLVFVFTIVLARSLYT